MTEAIKETLLELLVARLEDGDEDTLESCLEDAAAEVQGYLGWTDDEWETDSLPNLFQRKIVQLAAVLYRRDAAAQATGGAASRSYSEGDVSQSEAYLSGEDYQSQADGLLASLARYRRRGLL
ncbi:MAG: hypothetical protein LIO70_03625 [Clostridiales bacterium]|nr:hypothetical protein [Clostridiales bacterium]